jgi:STE24 endopeptidase
VDVGADGDAHAGRIVYSVPTRLRLLTAIAGALAVAEAAALLLRPRDRPVPVDVEPRAYFSPAELAKARRYRAGQLRLYGARVAAELGLLGLAVRHAPRWLPPARGGWGPVPAGAAAGAALSTATVIVALPLSAIGHARGRSVGLVTQGWRGWAADTAKRTTIEAPLSAAAGALLVAGLQRLGRGWWAPGSVAVVAFSVAGTVAAPVLLDPLFNRFTPLADGELRAEVLDLAGRAGVRVGEVYEVDASRRTSAANAYVAGLGPTKRVVLFDTLLRDFTPGEVRMVVAHELAHQRFHDVPRSLVFGAVVAPLALLAAARVAELLAPAGGERGPAAVPAVALASALLVPGMGVVSNQLSRAVEVRADRFAIDLTGDPATLVEFHRRIAVKNLADPAPPRWVRALLGTHPTTMERIGHALAARP